MFAYVVFSIVLCAVIYRALLYCYTLYTHIKVANQLPGPKALPIIGNILYILQWNYDEFFDSLRHLIATYSSSFRVWFGPKLLIFVIEPNHIRAILENQECLNKSFFYKAIKPYAKLGLLVSTMPMWNMHRKKLSYSFQTNILRSFCEEFVKRSLEFVDKLEQYGDAECEIFNSLQNFTLNNFYGTMFGASDKTLKHLSSKNNQIVEGAGRLTEIHLYRIRKIVLFFDIIYNVTTLRRKQQKDLNNMYSFIKEVIEYRRKERKNMDVNSSRKILIDILLDALDDGTFTRQDVHHELNTMMIAGTETTARTLNFIIFMLGNYPQVQEKVYDEMFDIYGADDPNISPVKFEDLNRMEYLECVIKETLRLFPTAPIISRHLTGDVKMGEITLPKGVDVVVPIIDLHRNEKYWKNALVFDPERFLGKNSSNIRPYSYMPFSIGPRNCIGIKYAMIVMKVLLATVVRTHVFAVNKRVNIDHIKLNMMLLLNPVEPLRLKIKKRH